MTRPAADHRPPAGSAGFRRGLTIEGSRSLVSGARVGAAFRVVRSGATFRGTTMGSRILPVIAAAMLMGPLAAAAQVRLITDEEARAPSQPAPTTRAITRGPGVRLLTPTEVPARSFALKLAFEPRGGCAGMGIGIGIGAGIGAGAGPGAACSLLVMACAIRS